LVFAIVSLCFGRDIEFHSRQREHPEGRRPAQTSFRRLEDFGRL